MLTNPLRTPRPKLTGPIFGYAMVDVVGLSCVGIGASWFAEGKGAILTNFPTSTAEAVACTAGGIVIMLWSVSRILVAPTRMRAGDHFAQSRPMRHFRPWYDHGMHYSVILGNLGNTCDRFLPTGYKEQPTKAEQWRQAASIRGVTGIELVGTSSHPEGIGARIEVTAGGVTQVREAGGGTHRYSQNHGIHFGLGGNTVADVRVFWPNGTQSARLQQPVDRQLTVVQ